ncbi:glycosyltransferase family 4 protein, partial [Streptomyces sp. T-3]|nr:glycosyltransferase family 4 protein [Streptomyces sp. T-3]
PAAPPPAGRAHRLLFLTRGNANFLGTIKDHFALRTDVRHVDLAADQRFRTPLAHPGRLMAHLLGGGRSPEGAALERELRPLLDWADTVFMEWCTAGAALLTLVDPGPARVVLRLHNFEAFTQWPHLVDFSRVDDLVFVSAHLRDLVLAVAPRLGAPGGPRLHVVPNALELGRFTRPKQGPKTRFTVALVGCGGPAKDPRWALDVLRRLRARDGRYRLLLVGDRGDPDRSAAARRYLTALERDLAPLEAAGAVRRLGHQDDVPAVLTGAGVILSSSVTESFHCAVMEGAASGALPVVRDWPFYAHHPNGAHTLFPPDWVVRTPRAAARRILKATSTEATWRTAGEAASAYALGRWDWPVVREEFDQLLLPDSPADPHQP